MGGVGQTVPVPGFAVVDLETTGFSPRLGDRVAEVAVIGTPDPKWIEAVTAVVVLKDGQDVTEAEIIDGTRAHLAPFKVPKHVVFVDELPRNQSGKLLKRELRQS